MASNRNPAPLPSIDEVRATIKQHYPGEEVGPAQPTFGGYSNLTVALDVGGRPLVAKVAHLPPKRADVRREAHILTLLRGSGLPVPELVALLEAEQWTIELLQHLDGTNGMHFFTTGQETLPALYAAVGQVLGAVHRCEVGDWGSGNSTVDLDLLPRYREVWNTLGTIGLPSSVVAALQGALDHPVWQQPGTRLVHGDAGLHNVLWDGQLRALLDWEWAGRGLPLLDLAWTAWIMRFRNLPFSLWHMFLAAYRSSTSEQLVATADELRALALGQIAFVLTRTVAATWPREEWMRRAELTIDFAFPTIDIRGG